MTSKLVPQDPSKVMVIRNVTPNIWTCSQPFNRFGRFKVGGRGTIVRLQNGSLAVFSPTALTPEVRSTVEQLGNNVGYLASTNIEHHIFLTEWAKAYPSAKLLGPEGLQEKRQKAKETAGTTFQHIWTPKTKHDMRVDPDFDQEFETEYVGSHGNKELVFCHKPDRTLIQADLIFNLPANEQYSKVAEGPTGGIGNKMFIGLMSASGTAIWQKRFLWYSASSADRPSFNQSMKKINIWDFDRIIPCHGDVVESGGKGVFQKVMEWHLKAAKN